VIKIKIGYAQAYPNLTKQNSRGSPLQTNLLPSREDHRAMFVTPVTKCFSPVSFLKKKKRARGQALEASADPSIFPGKKMPG
jgi:hypothetical protein